MGYRSILPLVLCSLLLSCDSDDYPNADIPSVVLNKFKSSYPKAFEPSWKEVSGNYEVEFENGIHDAKLLISSSGDILRTKQDISLEDLPQAIQDHLEKKFGKENIEDPELVTTGAAQYYQVEIDRFLFDEKIVLDQKGEPSGSATYWD